MRLEHPDYIKLVIAAYNEKRANNELSPSLAQSTPANIKRECLTVYKERYNVKDEKLLRDFFGPAEPGRKFLNAIQDLGTDKFKPLHIYLKGGTEKTDDRNLELLAWLIDFEYRPYVYGMEVLLSEKELLLIRKPGSDTGENKTKAGLALVDTEAKSKEVKESLPGKTEEDRVPGNGSAEVLLLTSTTNRPRKNIFKKAAIIFLTLVVAFGGVYAIRKYQESGKMAFGNQNTGCMYWADNHYQEVPCNEEVKGRLVLPMNVEKMRNFKRIMKEDTITERSIGKVHYIKRNGAVEFYTAGGNHPVEPDRSLKPLSAYMYKTYLQKESIPNKDSVSGEALNHINNR